MELWIVVFSVVLTLVVINVAGLWVCTIQGASRDQQLIRVTETPRSLR